MEDMNNVLQNLMMEGANPGDYLDEEGLLCCGNCHTRKQPSLPVWYHSGLIFQQMVSKRNRTNEETSYEKSRLN